MSDLNKENAIDVTEEKNGKVLKVVEHEGEGSETPWAGTEVIVHYTGCLENGEKFDSSRDRDQPFTFKLGEGQVIKGWDVGVTTMKKGEKCKLIIDSEYGYGARGSPPKIPGGATLIFDVELLEWKIPEVDVTGDKGVIMKVLKAGEGDETPNKYAQVKIHIRGTHDGKVFEERDVEFIIGEGEEVGVPKGIEKAIKKMKKYEKAHVILQPAYGFAKSFPNEFDIPPTAVVEYEVYLYTFEREKAPYDLTFDERKDKAQFLKDKGLELFKAGEHSKAVKCYERILKYVDTVGNSDTEFATLQYLRFPAHLNSALCWLKLKDFDKAKTHCDNVLKEDEANIKALFRRGEAYLGLDEAPTALKDFEQVVKLEPENKAAARQVHVAKISIKKSLDKEKALFAKMMSMS